MSFNAEFVVEGRIYRVLKCQYSSNRDVDATGRPSSQVRAGKIDIEVESTSDSFLVGWGLNHWNVFDGKITFYKRDNLQKMIEVSFKKGHCIKYLAEFDFVGEMPMIEKITISAMELTIGTVYFTNEWPDT